MFDSKTSAVCGIRIGKLFEESTKDSATALLNAIQMGAPLARELCRTLGCPKWTVRRFHYMPMSRLAEFRGSLPMLAQDLAAFGPDLTPRPERYADLWELLHSLDNDLTWRLLKPAIEQCRIQHNYRPLITLMPYDQRCNVRDYLSFISNLWAVLPHKPSDTITLAEALGNPSLEEWIYLNRHWHDVSVRAYRRLALAYDTVAAKRRRWSELLTAKRLRWPALFSARRWWCRRWKPLFKGCVVVDGYEFKVLRNARELEEEGMALEHCVGSYDERCACGRTHIASMRLQGHRIATLQFDYEIANGQQWILRLCQARGRRNKVPEGAVAAAIQQFARKIFCGEIPVDPGILQNLIKDLPNRQATGSKWRLLPDLSELAIAVSRRTLHRWILRKHNRNPRQTSSVDHLFALAEIDKQHALNLYRPCLETNPGAGTLTRMLEASLRVL